GYKKLNGEVVPVDQERLAKVSTALAHFKEDPQSEARLQLLERVLDEMRHGGERVDDQMRQEGVLSHRGANKASAFLNDFRANSGWQEKINEALREGRRRRA
ncbi:MAG: hypothetical protein V1723_01795, partial [Candidatus Uhrbacteria bacterium]